NLSERLIKDYFAEDGIQYSIGRIPIAGTDFSTRKYAYNEVDGDFNLTHFELAEEDINLKIPTIKYALNVSKHEVKLFGSAWSSPKWMKTNNELEGAGVLKGNTTGPYYKTWADYAVKFLNHYRTNGIELWGMTTGNEPMAGFIPGYRWNCLGFTPFSQRDFVKLHLGPALEKAGYTPENFKVMIHDDQLPSLPIYAEIVLRDANASKYISGVALHWYQNNYAPREFLNFVHNKFPDKFILATEACEGAGISPHVSFGDWSRGENYASDILKDLNHWSTGWVDWNIALDLNGGPTWAENFVDSPIIVNSTANEYYKNPMYYALGHFSRFLVPSSIRLDSTTSTSWWNPVLYTVFETPKQEIVLVALNPSDEPTEFTVRDPKHGIITFSFEAHSIVTLTWV
ncbi:glucosylceramidase-like protein, partial [Leptotrombidium deliense]